MAYTIDQSWSYTDPAADVAAGINCVSMYLSYDPSKNATLPKIQAYHNAGIDVLLNWEAGAGDALLGAARGLAHGQEAVRQALMLGAPAHASPPIGIYFSDDTDSTEPQVDAYYRAASQVVRAAGFRVGAYGGADVVVNLMRLGVTDLAWVANASSWNHGVSDAGANLHQLLAHPIHVAGTPDSGFDVNTELTQDFGQWYSHQGVIDLQSDERVWLKAAFDEIDFIFKVITGDANANSKPNFLTDIHNAWGLAASRFDALNKAIQNLVVPTVTTDPVALAKALAPLLTAEEAKAVVDELARRVTPTHP